MSRREVLVTGGAGFIGSHVVDRLVATGYGVRVLDDLSAGSLANIGVHLRGGAVRFVKGDVRDVDAVRSCVEGVDAVLHLAAVVSVPLSVEKPEFTRSVNVEGTRVVLEAAAQAGVERVVYASSCAVYGEPACLPVDEGHPTCPVSPYAWSKLQAERVCGGFQRRLSCTVLRLFNVYGPRQGDGDYAGVITRFISRARRGEALVVYGDGAQTRDFVSVFDVAEAFLLALQGEAGVFNVGSGVPTTVNALAQLVLDLTGARVGLAYAAPRAGDIRHSYADISRARQRLGFQPRVSLREGLRGLVEALA